MDMPFLLNLKAHQYCSGHEHREIISKDNGDIVFMLQYMKTKGTRVTSDQCPRVVCNDFWQRFVRNCPVQEVNLRAVGLRRVGHDADSNSMLAVGRRGQGSGDASNVSTPRSDSASQSSGHNSNCSTPKASLGGPSNVATPTSHSRLLRAAERRSTAQDTP